ncbi:hypothetical protein QTH87_06355 [Variovorax sp. J22P168]|nr:hypothetical protein [Variovorax sp. J22P168]MDM0012061.1 hypothetical protein [Variovorax sp. J22P168]
MAIALMVMYAALGTLLISRGATAQVQELAQLQQQASYAMHLIGLQIRQAGAVDPVRDEDSGLYAFPAPGTDVDAGPKVFGTEGRDGASDTVTLSFAPVRWPNPAARAAWQYDCIGARVENDERVQARFAIDTRRSSLVCRSLRGSQPVIGQVVDLQVRYRVVTAGVTRELDANQVEAAALWPSVMALEVCLDLKGEERAPDSAALRYRDCSDRERPRDGRVHQVIRHLFHLRNA